MAQKITPELLQLRQRDHDVHKVLKVALQPWPTLAGKEALIDFGLYRHVRESYFRADYFCKDRHEDNVFRHKLRKTAVDSAEQAGGGSIVPIVPMDKFFYEMKRPRTIADLNYGLVTGSSSSLTSAVLGTLPSSSGGVVLRSRFFGYGQRSRLYGDCGWRLLRLRASIRCLPPVRAPFMSHPCCSLASSKQGFSFARGCFSATASADAQCSETSFL